MPETTKLHPKQPVAAALASRAAVRPALRQGGAFALGLAGGWAVLYGALLPFGLGLTLGLPADCFAACAAGAALSILFHGFGAFSLDSLCLLCAVGAAVAARWLWPGRLRPAFLAGCGALVLGGACFALGPGGAGFTLVFFCGADALLAGSFGYALQRFPPEKPGFGTLLAASAVAAALGGLRFGPLCLGAAACAMVDAALCCRGQESPRWPLLPSPGPRSAPQTLPLPRQRWGSAAARRPRSCWFPGGGLRPLPPVRAGVCWGYSVFPPPARPCPCSSAPGWALRPPPFSQNIG